MEKYYLRDFPSGYYSNRNRLSPPPDRGEDAAIAGADMYHTEQITWKRRPGFEKWSTYEFADTNAPQELFDYTDDDNVQRLIVDGEEDIREVDPTTGTLLLMKSDVGQVSFAVHRTTLYAGGPTGTDVKHKRPSGGGTFKAWGITQPSVAPTFALVAGTATIRIGWKYKYVWKDSSDGHISSSSAATASTGPDTTSKVELTVQGTAEARVDKIEIYRTRDGGSTFFLLDEITNTGAGAIVYEDEAPDTDLNTLIIGPSQASNDGPPSNILDLTDHRNRLWMIAGDEVRFCASNIDAETGLVNGVAEECWPPNYGFSFPGVPVTLQSVAQGLLVFTRGGQVYLIAGKTRFDFDPDKIYTNLPVSTKNCVARDGDVLYVYTSNRQILRITDSIENIGVALSEDDLDVFNPESTRLTVHRQGTQSALYMTNGDNKIFCYSMTNGTWSPQWETVGDVSAGIIKSVHVDPIGTFHVFITPRSGDAGFLWALTHDVHSDDGETYDCFIQFGSFVLCEPDEITALEAVITQTNVEPEVTVRIGEISGTPTATTHVVDEPPRLTEPTTIVSKRHYLSPTPLPLEGQHFQVKLRWDATDDEAELFGLGLLYEEPRS